MRLRIGIIAPDFPPAIGGMQELARGLASALAVTDDVSVYTLRDRGVPDAPFEQKPVLTGELAYDVQVLSEANVDTWISLNAGLVAMSAKLQSPFYAYFHGKDFLNPWLGYESSLRRFVKRILPRSQYVALLGRAEQRMGIKSGIKRATHLFTNSECTARLIQEHFSVARKRISVIPPGVDDAFFQERDIVRDGPLRILTVARLVKKSARKNVEGVLRAIALLRPRVSLRYTVVGDGDDRERLEGIAYALGIMDTVTFCGEVTKDHLLAYYRRSDLFILAAKADPIDIEGFGIVYLEASASGVPVICSQEGGSTEAVKDGWNGMIIPSSSPEEIASGVIRFIGMREQFLPHKMKAFAEEFRWPKIAGHIRQRITSFIS